MYLKAISSFQIILCKKMIMQITILMMYINKVSSQNLKENILFYPSFNSHNLRISGYMS